MLKTACVNSFQNKQTNFLYNDKQHVGHLCCYQIPSLNE